MVARNRPPLRRRRGRPRFFTRKRVCSFCVEHVSHIDYKDIPRLRRYISERSRMDPRRKTGTCARHQRGLSVAIKRARHVALIPFTQGQLRTAGDS